MENVPRRLDKQNGAALDEVFRLPVFGRRVAVALLRTIHPSSRRLIHQSIVVQDDGKPNAAASDTSTPARPVLEQLVVRT